MSWIFNLIQLVFNLWSKRPNPLAEEAHTAGVATQIAEDSQKSVEVDHAELQAAVNSSGEDSITALEKGTF